MIVQNQLSGFLFSSAKPRRFKFLFLQSIWFGWFLIQDSVVFAQGSGGNTNTSTDFNSILNTAPQPDYFSRVIGNLWLMIFVGGGLAGTFKILRGAWKMGRSNGEGLTDVMSGGAMVCIASIISFVVAVIQGRISL